MPTPNSESEDSSCRLASFDEALGLPPAPSELIEQAARAVRQEYRDCSKWKRMTCEKVSVVVESERGIIHVVHVDGAVDFDWTWEGATAFRPKSEAGLVNVVDYSDPELIHETALWSGEILEVDEQNGCLFISLDNPEVTPVPGEFSVRPFEFLATLNTIYNDEVFAEVRNEELDRRLNASCGGIHPVVRRQSKFSLPELENWWQYSWSVLWGPPGTGKTYTTGRQVAAAIEDPAERILVVSTTNQATDAVAISIGNAIRQHDSAASAIEEGLVQRVGKGAAWQAYRKAKLADMLRGTESALLAEMDKLGKKLASAESTQDRAMMRMHLQQLRDDCSDCSKKAFLDPDVSVVVATAFKAVSLIKDEFIAAMVNESRAPFTTIIIDEAGLISRSAVAALSLLASDRVVLVGDSKQLAPISRIARVLPSRQAKWLSSSGVTHLEDVDTDVSGVHLLSQQYRMHQEIGDIVSSYQYGGRLTTSQSVRERKTEIPGSIIAFARALWCVLDEEEVGIDQIRASRGPANKSWIRAATPAVLQKLFEEDEFKSSHGLFITPFKAQADSVAALFAKWKATSWQASTVHSQQGAESDIVIFDTVNAGNVTWPVHEWQRLVNVALSRAREAVIVLASRSEMDEPHLRTLKHLLKPAILKRSESGFAWQDIQDLADTLSQPMVREARSDYALDPSSKKTTRTHSMPRIKKEGRDSEAENWTPKHRLGDQFASRRTMHPVLSREQQRLSGLDLDGKPRLVRGVAGSGKSVVMANWVARISEGIGNALDEGYRIWTVYSNRSLHKLLQDSILAAWEERQQGGLFAAKPFPWRNVSLMHVKDVLESILPEVGLSAHDFGFEYDLAAETFLQRNGGQGIEERCNALFIDEAQDMGPSMLRLLLSLVQQTSVADPNSRSANIFYDNAQNIYGAGTPKWSDYGIDMRGRSTIMRESFRSTKPIIEFAVNVLDHLSETEEHHELVDLGLLKEVIRGGNSWLQVGFNQVSGPRPHFQACPDIDSQLKVLGDHLVHLLTAEAVSPNDICILYNGKHVVEAVMNALTPRLAAFDVELSHQVGQSFQRRSNTVLITTPNSFKGYEAEVVLIPCADQFVGAGYRVLAKSLYVAMTRARSILAIYSMDPNSRSSGKPTFSFGRTHRQVAEVLQECAALVEL
ncbi:AAA domain-containing protein [Mariniblastus fucicola]|uniref:RecBCD enzyme subunit RecD n=2 Tax=Mariniblastus fucicola TaxID=980251 RepID=A0A5B9PH37_9BACT|nr:AAA domain-containing protein [Mariniblastus fucicola]QEG24565.1 RecBCD enzyme subunit RecD [Mariniblastus fucicola]